MKHITLDISLCSSSSFSPSSRFPATRVRNIGASHIRVIGLCHNVKSHVCCYTTSSSRQKKDSGISKNNSSVCPGLSQKSCCSAKIIQTFKRLVTNKKFQLHRNALNEKALVSEIPYIINDENVIISPGQG